MTARSPSPPPLHLPTLTPDALDPRKLERLGRETEDFRARQRREFAEKEVERKEAKAREILVDMDREKGVKVGGGSGSGCLGQGWVTLNHASC